MSAPSDKLLIDISAQASPFLSADGQVVWPVRSDEELRALKEVATLFGAAIVPVTASPGKSTPEGDDEVVTLGDDVEAEGRLYAHLTRRHFRAAKDLSEVRGAAPLAVVITTPAWLRSDLFSTLYENCPGPAAPGILCAPSSEIRRQVLVRSAAAVLCGPVAARRVDIFPELQIAQLRVRDRLILGGCAPELIRPALRAGCGVLSIQTHSDGVDAMLASGLTLCPMDWMRLDASLDETNRCVETGYCHRHYAPLSEVIGSASAVSPSEIRARVLVWHVCFGVVFADGILDPQWSIGSRLLNHCGIGSIVTTWGMVFPQPRFLNMLAGSIDQGLPVGEAVHAFNSSPEATWFGERVCLLGDPRVSLPCRQPEESPPTEWNPGNLDFIKIFLTVAGAGAADNAEQQRALAKAADVAGKYEAMKMTTGGQANADVEQRFRETVLDCVCMKGPLILHDWGRYARMRAIKIEPPKRCTACDRPHAKLSSVLAHFEVPWIPERRISHCPYCGIVEDVPTDSALQMSIEDGSNVRLSGQLPSADWSGRLLVRPQLKHELAWWPWPAAPDGRPMDRFRLPEAVPSGILQIAVILMHEEKLAILALFHRLPHKAGHL